MNYFEKHQVNYNRENIPIQVTEYMIPKFPAHWHIDTEIIAVTSGTITIGYNFDIYTLYTGDFMLIPGGNIHHFSTSDNGRALLLLLSAETIISKEEADVFSMPVIIKNIDTAMFKDMYNRIYDELINAGTAYKIMIKSYLGLLSGWILRNRTEDNILKSKQLKRKLLNDSQKLFKHIEDNYSRRITLEEGAKFMHFEKNYFCRYFRLLTGTTFTKYVNIIRTQTAQNMLLNTDLPINEIALRCGFNTVRTFNREFKSFTGITAMQYKQSINNK